MHFFLLWQSVSSSSVFCPHRELCPVPEPDSFAVLFLCRMIHGPLDKWTLGPPVLGWMDPGPSVLGRMDLLGQSVLGWMDSPLDKWAPYYTLTCTCSVCLYIGVLHANDDCMHVN